MNGLNSKYVHTQTHPYRVQHIFDIITDVVNRLHMDVSWHYWKPFIQNARAPEKTATAMKKKKNRSEIPLDVWTWDHFQACKWFCVKNLYDGPALRLGVTLGLKRKAHPSQCCTFSSHTRDIFRFNQESSDVERRKKNILQLVRYYSMLPEQHKFEKQAKSGKKRELR